MKFSFFKSSLSRTFISGILVLSFLVVSFHFIFQPKKVEAGAVSCLGGYVSGLLGSVTGLSVTVNDTGLNFSECVLKPMAIVMAKTLVRNIGTNIVNWINTGFKGNPAFVTNLGGFLENTADEAIGSFIEGSDLGFLCRSFSVQIRLALATKYRQPWRQRATCTLTDITNNVNSFVDKNGNVGWDNWLNITTVPQNNVYGAYIMAENELTARIAKQVGLKTTQLTFGNGFLDFETCDQWETDAEVNMRLNSGGGFQAQAGTNYISNTNPTGSFTTGSGGPTSLGSFNSVTQSYSGSSGLSNQAGSEKKCLKSSTKTPGKVIESQLNTTLGAWANEIGLATEIDQVVGALVNKLAETAITGAQGLLGLSKTGGSQSYAVRPINFNQALTASNNTNDGNLSNISTAIDQVTQTETAGQNVSSDDIALGKTVTSSSGGNLSSATDGTTAFVTGTDGNEPNPWIEVDLGSANTVNQILLWRDSTIPVSIALETFTVSLHDGTNTTWTSNSVTPQEDGSNPIVIPVNASGRYVRVSKTATAYQCPPDENGISGGNCYYPLLITEIEVISGGAGTQTSTTGTSVPTGSVSWYVNVYNPTIIPTLPFVYELNLMPTEAMTGLKMTTSLKKDGTPFRFLDILSELSFVYGTSNQTLVGEKVTSSNDGSKSFTNISTSPNSYFILKYVGTKKNGAPSGTYTIETTVSNSNNVVLKTQTNNFLIP